MPKPLQVCGCGCGALVQSGQRCRPAAQQRERWRGSRQERGYNAEWDNDSRTFRRAYPFCGMRPNDAPPVMSRCHELGIVTPAYQTDHVVPHRGDPALFKDHSKAINQQPNWQSLCRECGARKSAAGL